MTTHNFIEDAELSGVRETKDGYLVAEVRCARAGIQNYLGSELGLMDKQVVKVYRPESEVFSTDSLATFTGKPVTNDHPPEMVNASNWKQYAVGDIGEEVLRDGQFIRVPIKIMDAAAIQQIKDGKRQVSMGYTHDLSIEQGTTPEGDTYDAVMRGLKMNHLAIVQRGRAGSEVRIGDSWGAHPITINDRESNNMTLKTIVVDGLPVEITDAGAAAIDKLTAKTRALKDAAVSAQSTHDAAMQSQQAAHDAVVSDKDKALATKDTELATKDAEIAELKTKVIDGKALDALVAKRAKFVAKAKAIVGDSADFTEKSDLDIMKAVVDKVHGENFSADKADAYIETAFDLAKIPEGTTDSVRGALLERDPPKLTNDNGYTDHVKWLGDAYKGEAA